MMMSMSKQLRSSHITAHVAGIKRKRGHGSGSPEYSLFWWFAELGGVRPCVDEPELIAAGLSGLCGKGPRMGYVLGSDGSCKSIVWITQHGEGIARPGQHQLVDSGKGKRVEGGMMYAHRVSYRPCPASKPS
jgi:hypothetical protein